MGLLEMLLRGLTNLTGEAGVWEFFIKEVEVATSLELSRPPIADAEVAALGRALQEAPLPRLETLSLEYQNIGETGIAELAAAIDKGNLVNLQTLSLKHNAAGPMKLAALARAMQSRNLPNLRALDLTNNFLGEPEMLALADALGSGNLRNLRRLCLGTRSSWDFNRRSRSSAREGGFSETIEIRGAEALARALESGGVPLLEELKLVNFAEAAVVAMMRALESGQVMGLTCLSVEHCTAMGAEGARAIASAIKKGPLSTLSTLHITGTEKLGEEGAEVILGALKSPNLHDLAKLGLENTAIPEPQFLNLVALLKAGHLPSLRYLSLDSEAISIAAAQELVAAYRQNPFFIAKIETGWPTAVTRRNAEGFRRHNETLLHSLRLLIDEPDIPGTHGKVFLCGHPKVGKTTLRKSLCRSKWKAYTSRERNSRVNQRTRGIEVSTLERKRIKIGLWDLAGQAEYHLLHSAFLPDLAFADGVATIFVIVCSANYSGGSTVDSAEEELLYWLRFISASSVKGIRDLRRHVFVVLNSFNGDHSHHDSEHWRVILEDCSGKFADSLHIHPEPFVMDAQLSRKVEPFKRMLEETAEKLLRDKRVPKVCGEIQGRINLWLNGHRDYPVLPWRTFFSVLSVSVSEEKLMAATTYLHEAGQLIYFREGALQEGGLPDESLVILDPQWFCKSIVGDLLLPESLLRPGETSLRRKMRANGSLPISALQAHFPRQLSDARQVEAVTAMLLRLGLTYRIGEDNIFVPSLIEQDEIPEFWSRRTPGHRVMGFALVLQDTETTLLPIAVMRKLQVTLAQNAEIGGRSDSQYSSGKNIITFKSEGMAVLVEYSADPRNAKYDRMDVLVRPLVGGASDPGSLRARQVNLARAILDLIVEISSQCCPGIEFDKRVVKPWGTSEWPLVPMGTRNVETAVEEVKKWVQLHGTGKPTNWDVENDLVLEHELLSREDLQELQQSTQDCCELIEKAVFEFQLLDHPLANPLSRSHEFGRADSLDAESDGGVASPVGDGDPLERAVRRIVRDEGQSLKNYFSKKLDDVMSAVNDVSASLQTAFNHRKQLIDRMQSFERFSLSRAESSIPRFLFLASKVPGSGGSKGTSARKWVKIRDAMSMTNNLTLHFLCEAQFGSHTLHEVEGQEGIELSKLSDWAQKLVPVLEWSLKAAFVVAKIAGTALLPGLGLLMPEISQNTITNLGELAKGKAELMSCLSTSWNDKKLESSSLDAMSMESNSYGNSSRNGDGDGNNGGALRGEGRAAVKDLLDQFTASDRLQKTRLRPVVLTHDDGAPKEVVWICNDCFCKYGKSAREI